MCVYLNAVVLTGAECKANNRSLLQQKGIAEHTEVQFDNDNTPTSQPWHPGVYATAT